jgi:VWFA-related protein
MMRRLLALVLVAAAAVGARAMPSPSEGMRQAPATFKAGAEAVRVDVLVTDGARPVLGLTAADFDVLDNGVPQEPRLLGYQEVPANLLLALDVSFSVRGEHLVHLIEASQAMLDAIGPADTAGLLTFNNGLSLRVPPGSSPGLVRSALPALSGSGSTSLYDAAHASMLRMTVVSGRPLLVIFSDGIDTVSWLAEDEVLDTARRSGVLVYAVRTGGRGSKFLDTLTKSTGGTLFDVEKTADLEGAFLKVLDEFKSRYLIGFVPAGPPVSGWHRLEVRVKGRRVTVKARPGYLRPE